MINVTRLGKTHEKKGVSLLVFKASPENFAELSDATGDFLVGYLPGNAVVNAAEIFTTVVSDATTVTVGTTDGGTEILSAGDSTTLDETGTFTGKSFTGTGVPVYINLAVPPTVGEFYVIVEYRELELSTGNLTLVD
jgi:hypothetical protein